MRRAKRRGASHDTLEAASLANIDPHAHEQQLT